MIEDDNLLLAVRNALGLPAVKARHLDGGFHRFDPAILGQHLVAVGPETGTQGRYEFCHAGQKQAQGIGVYNIRNNGSIIAQQGLDQGIDNFGMMMPRIGSGVGGQAVQVTFAADIGNPAPARLSHHDV